MDIHGDQVAYNGHLLYTFADDQAGQVTGQGVQGFFVATPGLAPIAGSSTSAGSSARRVRSRPLRPAAVTATEAAWRPGPLAPFVRAVPAARTPDRRTPDRQT